MVQMRLRQMDVLLTSRSPLHRRRLLPVRDGPHVRRAPSWWPGNNDVRFSSLKQRNESPRLASSVPEKARNNGAARGALRNRTVIVQSPMKSPITHEKSPLENRCGVRALTGQWADGPAHRKDK
jgi:hypothetical protein